MASIYIQHRHLLTVCGNSVVKSSWFNILWFTNRWYVAPKHGQWHWVMAEKIEFPVSQIILSLYFASSGVKTEIGSINSPFLGGITVLVLFVALFAKFYPVC